MDESARRAGTTSDTYANEPVTLHYESPLPQGTRESRLSIASTVLPIAGSPFLIAPILGWLGVPHHALPGAILLLFLGCIALPVAAMIRIHLSNCARTGIGWAICGLVTALTQLAISVAIS